MDDLKQLLEQSQQQLEKLQNEYATFTLREEEKQIGDQTESSQETTGEEEFEKEIGRERGMSLEQTLTQMQVPESKSRRPQSIPSQRKHELLTNPPTTLRGVLENCTVTELALMNWLRKRPILISENQTIERALSRINAHEVHSLPVVNENKDVIGLIDVVDLATAISQSLKDKPVPLRVRNDFMTKTVGSLFLQKHTKSYVISNKTSLWHAAEQLVSTQQERLLIVDRDSFIVEIQTHPESRVDGLLSASDILRFLTQNILLMRQEALFSKRLVDLGLPSRTPKKCLLSDNVGKVFTDMGEQKLDGVAVVELNGKLKANLSTIDLRGLTRKNVGFLNNTVENFILHDRKRGWWVRPIIITPQETLISCILQFVCTKCHRMYQVDENFSPIGEINIMDVIKELINIK